VSRSIRVGIYPIEGLPVAYNHEYMRNEYDIRHLTGLHRSALEMYKGHSDFDNLIQQWEKANLGLPRREPSHLEFSKPEPNKLLLLTGV